MPHPPHPDPAGRAGAARRHPPHIAILGAGFAALAAVRRLRRQAPQARITLIAPEPVFTYLPSLIWIPTGLRDAGDLRVPLRGFLDRHRAEFVAARATGLADGGRRVLTSQGEIANDALLIATGGRFLRALPGIEHAHILCEGPDAACAIRERLVRMDAGRLAFGFGTNPREPGAMRGGPIFELLFGIETWLRRTRRRDRFELTFFHASERPGERLGARAVPAILADMAARGIRTRLGEPPRSFTAEGVVTAEGSIPADMILFMPGLEGPDWAAASGLPLSPGGFFRADAHCRVEGAQRVYVAGDAGSHPGPDWLPKQAHMAELQADAAARNLLDELAGRPPRARPRPELLCVIDTLDAGTLVYRGARRSWMLPRTRLLHWAKKRFEARYLGALRRDAPPV
ncbi:NAD(P)/FAD-dependent oxidoreductase [Castellaniella defragrans]|uniref:Sulfide:quinone oxidoreductase n=1 Tax=Castellaniella defragrans TaxID=75697 RepID=A0A7W9TNP5_CASDE|nr:FAD-dependent oxidoreductase [Castellaniella defragrans]KAB0615110.1 NAD(P)/FAD-dependent oxidoreductase [Castellaniella defragrans]MBB6083894.1 sulfide:quinone oxidoreductase [Castellaniella defragrans]